jgi:hypothetical protein
MAAKTYRISGMKAKTYRIVLGQKTLATVNGTDAFNPFRYPPDARVVKVKRATKKGGK